MQLKLVAPRRAFVRLAQVPLIVLILHLAVAAQTLLVASNAEHHATLIHPGAFETLANLPAGQGPHEITLSPDGRLAYVANSGAGPNGIKGNTITVLDLPNRRVKATFNLGAYVQPHDTRLSRDGRLLWVTCAPAQTILELDANDGKILKTYAIKQEGAWFLTATPDGRKIYTANLEGKSVSRIERATGQAQVFPFDAEVFGIDITPDGREVWVTSSSVHVIDTATDRVVASLKADDGGTNRIRLTPDGKKIAFQSPRDGDGSDTNLYVMNADGSQQMKITHHKGFTGVPNWSPDGKEILHQWRDDTTNDKRWHIYLINADGSNPRRLSQDAANNQAPNWPPDGKRILFYSDKTGNNQIYVMDADGSNITRLTNNAANDHAAFWSRDGKRIVFCSDRDGSRDVYTMNADGSQQRRVTTGATAFQSSWSPDGRRLLFTFIRNGQSEIYTVKPDGAGLTKLTAAGH